MTECVCTHVFTRELHYGADRNSCGQRATLILCCSCMMQCCNLARWLQHKDGFQRPSGGEVKYKWNTHKTRTVSGFFCFLPARSKPRINKSSPAQPRCSKRGGERVPTAQPPLILSAVQQCPNRLHGGARVTRISSRPRLAPLVCK